MHSQSLLSERFLHNLSVTVYLMLAPNRLVFSETRVQFLQHKSPSYDEGGKHFSLDPLWEHFGRQSY